jgi:hypothetical protein
MAKPAFTIDEAKDLKRRYEGGETTIELSKEYGVGDSCIASWIKKAGGRIRSNSESKRKYKFDEHFFDNIDTELKAYWLGFFMADGYIGKFLNKWRNFWCTLAAKDGDHLEAFLNDINATYSAKYYERDGHQKAQICLTSIPFVDNLINKGWIKFKKDGDLSLLDCVPEHLFHHFVRGFFDGDGSIMRQLRKDRNIVSYSYSVVVVGPLEHKEFLESIKHKICECANMKVKSLKKGGSVWRMHWNGNKQIKRFGEWLYKDATRHLQRKKDRFDELSNKVTFNWPQDNKFSCSHTPTQISKMSDVQKSVVVSKFCSMISKKKWVAPAYSDAELIADHRMIKLFDSTKYVVMDGEKVAGFRLNTGSNVSSPGKKIVLHYQPHFWNVKTSAPPIVKQWENIKVVNKAAQALLCKGSKITFDRFVREMRYAGTGITSHFHPNFAIAILKSLAPNTKSWFDPSMGWGGRMMAAKTINMDYEGCDPQPDTYNGLINIKKFIESDAILHNIKAQDYVFNRRFDVGFSSPPFFSKEKYGGSEQSHIEFNNYNIWITEFLCVVIDKMLKNCDKVILHVDKRITGTLSKLYDFDKYPLFLQRNPGGPIGTESVLVFK